MEISSENQDLRSLADQRILVLEPSEWDELQETLRRAAAPNPRIAALLALPSILEDA